ncbi:DUF4347 domain-containing protein, partial [Pseudomonas fluorescens]|uniref:DUF4347 domain-containing protein n=1 Tax=Pseudomonas fluorescens TaxID=294 RepID=UPI001131A23F
MASSSSGNDKVLGRRLHLLALEPRMMFDGAAVAVAPTVIGAAMAPAGQDGQAAGHDHAAAPDTESKDPVTHDAAPLSASPLAADAPRSEIAFVSNKLANWHELADSFAPNVQVVILDGARDGVEQMGQALAGRTGIDAIHLLTHGVAGQIDLGTATLNESSMQGQYRDALSRIGASLADSGDILVYGCDFSAGASGLSAARTLSSLTGADVAASNDFTGAARFGGDWDLETHIGVVETQVGVSAAERASYDKLMAPPVGRPDIASTSPNTPVTIAVLANDSDPDNDALSIERTFSPNNGTVVINADQTLTYTPSAGFVGLDYFNYHVSDGNGGIYSARVSIAVFAPNTAPTNAVPLSVTVQEDSPLVFSAANGNALSVSDPDDNIQTVTLSVTKGFFTLSGIAGLTFTAGDGTADQIMTFSGTMADINTALEGAFFRGVADANGTAQLSFLTVTNLSPALAWINGGFEDPALPPNINFTLDEGSITGWSSDPDQAIEVWGSGYSSNSNGPVFSHEGNQFAELNAFHNGPLYQNFVTSNRSVLNIEFSHRGRLGIDTMQVIATDMGADGVFGTADDTVLLSEQFSDGNTQWGTYNRVITHNTTGNLIRLEFRAVSTSTGDLSVGNFIDGISMREGKADYDVVPLTIVPVADIVNDQARTSEDTPLTFNVITGANEVSGADNFENAGRALTEINGVAFVAGAPITISGGVIHVQSDGTVAFTPNANYNGSTSFNYTVSSGGAAETATVSILVDPVNDAPAGTDKAISLNEDGSYTFTAADFGFTDLNDTAADGFSTLIVTTLPSPLDGTLTLNGVAVTAGQIILVTDLG